VGNQFYRFRFLIFLIEQHLINNYLFVDNVKMGEDDSTPIIVYSKSESGKTIDGFYVRFHDDIERYEKFQAIMRKHFYTVFDEDDTYINKYQLICLRPRVQVKNEDARGPSGKPIII
jgi:hypothetical protein